MAHVYLAKVIYIKMKAIRTGRPASSNYFIMQWKAVQGGYCDRRNLGEKK